MQTNTTTTTTTTTTGKVRRNFRTAPATMEQYTEIVQTLREGYEYDKKHRPNPKAAMAIAIEANLGIRVSDAVQLKLSDIRKEGSRYVLYVTEKKTGKDRRFLVNPNIYMMLKTYAEENGIGNDERLANISTQQVQEAVHAVSEYLGYQDISTHSFRKMYAHTIYEQNNHDIALIQTLLQHSNPMTTMRYLSVSDDRVEEALSSYCAVV